jgi:hypothetical protein
MLLRHHNLRNLVRSLLSIPAIRALTISAALWLLAFAYCSHVLWRDPHSAFFKSERVYDLGYSQIRQQEARAYLERANATAGIPSGVGADREDQETEAGHVVPEVGFGSGRGGSAQAKDWPPQRVGQDPVICAAFVTVKREGKQYFPEAVGSMLEGLYPQERAALNVSVLFADTDPNRHPDYHAPWLPALVDNANGYVGVDEERMDEIRKAEEERNWYVKGLFDYLYVMENCVQNTRAPFIAIFEDDIIFSSDWLSRTLLALQHIIGHPPKNPSHPKESKPWMYLRLFYTETAFMWQADEDWWYAHLPFTLILSSVITASVLILVRRYVPQTIREKNLPLGLKLDMFTILVLSCITAPAFIALTFMMGKYNLPTQSLRNRPGGVVSMNKYGCCTQALVFNRQTITDLIAYLRMRHDGQTDSMIENYCDDNGLERLALGEQVVQHIGLVSSRDNTALNAQSTWAFWFETNTVQGLTNRHRSEFERIDWDVFKKLGQ